MNDETTAEQILCFYWQNVIYLLNYLYKHQSSRGFSPDTPVSSHNEHDRVLQVIKNMTNGKKLS